MNKKKASTPSSALEKAKQQHFDLLRKNNAITDAKNGELSLGAMKALDAGSAYFPICWSYSNPRHTAGRWRVNGKGIVAVTKKVYQNAGRWPEIHQWGSEDRMFFDSVAKLVPIVRQNEKGLYHLWHEPSSTPRRPSPLPKDRS